MHEIDALVESNDWDYYHVDEENTAITKLSGCSRVREGVNSIDQVRLRSSGVVEVKQLNKWGGICNNGFRTNEADVLCKQFGYELGVAQIGESSEKRYSGPIHLFDLSCQGEETDVSDLLLMYKYIATYPLTRQYLEKYSIFAVSDYQMYE